MSHRKLLVTFLALLFLSVAITSSTQAQTEGTAELKRRASELLKENNFTEALPILEKIAAAEPNDGETQFYLAFALLGQAINT
jgi:Flp pilus assembly protein TadD